jgi:protein TonB
LRALAFGDVATGAGAPLEGLAVADGGVFDLALLDEAPQPVMRLEPVYPPAARLRRQEGHVVMEFVVNEDGTTADITVLSAEPRGVFERAAAAAVKAWRFRPGRREGRAVATRVRQRVSFRLE